MLDSFEPLTRPSLIAGGTADQSQRKVASASPHGNLGYLPHASAHACRQRVRNGCLQVDVRLLRARGRGGLPIPRGVNHFAHAIEPVGGARA